MKNMGFQKLDLNLIAIELYKDVFFFSLPKVLGFTNAKALKC
jgi:hypothetical protein